MATRMQQRRGTGTQWTTANPVLAAGEIGFETDTNQFKMGDGVNVWSSLTYFIDTTALSTSLGDYVTLASAGAASGVATLDASGFVPAAQLNIDITSDINAAVAALVDGAPATLDTLNELAAAIGDNADFITTIQNQIDTKKTQTIVAVSTDITLVSDVIYIVDTSSARTLTLPAAPAAGNEIQIIDSANTAATHNITVNNGGSLINGVSDTLIIDVNGAIAKLVYTGSTLGWRI
jgi:hypothetical protein